MKKFLRGNKISCRHMIRRSILIGVVICLFLLFFKIVNVCNTNVTNPVFKDNGKVYVEMIDVGNGDAFLVLQDDKAMLVDTGFLSTYGNVRQTLKKWHVRKLDYVILTHPHRDHAGGFSKLIFDYHIDNIIIGNYPENAIMDKGEKLFLKIYETSLAIAQNFGANISYAQNEDGTFNDIQFANSQIHFLGPNSDTSNYDEINNYSLVFMLTYGNAKMLFTGDMEKINEKELLESGENLNADVLKVAHHGSYSSSSKAFLKAVSPTIALVSADNGNGNMYGHPGTRLVTNLEEMGVKLYRTDEQGNEVIVLGQRSIAFSADAGDYLSGTELYSAKQASIK